MWGLGCHISEHGVSRGVKDAHVGLGVVRGSPGVNQVNMGCVGSFPNLVQACKCPSSEELHD